jgi:hypothetical protein
MSIEFLIPLEWALKKVLIEIPADSVVKHLMKELDPEVKHIQDQLARIETAIERDRIAPFKTALRLIKYGKREKGFDELVRAHELNEFSPLVKIYLSLLLLEKGRSDDAREMLAEAAALNPYLVMSYFDNSVQVGISTESQNEKSWTIRLLNQEFIKNIPDTWYNKFFKYFRWYQNQPPAVIVSTSLCGNRLAVQWIFGDNLREKTRGVLTILDANDGSVLWHNFGEELRLSLITYNQVVVWNERDRKYLFLDLQTGSTVNASEMGEGYFALMYLGQDDSKDLLNFVKSNWRGTAPADAFEKSGVFFEPRFESSDETLNHKPAKWSEGATLQDPFGFPQPIMKIQNFWDHNHFSGGSVGLMPSCHLIGEGKIERVCSPSPANLLNNVASRV